MIIPDHAQGLPVLRALSLCTCCRHYPGAAAGRTLRSAPPAVSAFPERVIGSACASTFSRLAQRSLALRPAHSLGHLRDPLHQRLQLFRYLHNCSGCFGWSVCRVGFAPTGKRRLITAHTRSRLSDVNQRTARASFALDVLCLAQPKFAETRNGS